MIWKRVSADLRKSGSGQNKTTFYTKHETQSEGRFSRERRFYLKFELHAQRNIIAAEIAVESITCCAA